MEEGTLKEMKRWGYEIHSTFTAPGSVSFINRGRGILLNESKIHICIT